MAFHHAPPMAGLAADASGFGAQSAWLWPYAPGWRSDAADDSDLDAMELDEPEFVFQQTAGLPEEILLSILVELSPSLRAPLSAVNRTWHKLVQASWNTPWGSIRDELGFHVLVPSRILRQAIPHVAWSIPDFKRLPRGVPIVSPTFSIKQTSDILGRNIKWRLRLEIAPSTAKLKPDAELTDLTVTIEAVRPSDLPATPIGFTAYCRIDNPASYAWGHTHTSKVRLCNSVSSVKGISQVFSNIADENKGFILNDTVTILASVLPESHEYVSIFSFDDCRANAGPDLLLPSTSTPILSLPRKWNSGSQEQAQAVLKREYAKLRPDQDLHNLQFWRVIMRRNNTFRPVAPELKVYEEPFYAVFALDIREAQRGRACLFIKRFDGKRLHFFEHVFLDPAETFLTIFRRLGLDPQRDVCYEEVHARRVDPITDLTRTLRSCDIGDGDILVIASKEHSSLVQSHYASIVYTSPLVKVSPNMWHS